MKRIVYIFLVLLFGANLSFAVGAADRPLRETGKEAGLMLDLQKVSLGTLANVQQRRQYLSTVQLEKQRIQNFTLNMVYDNAYNIYKQGDYQRAAELSDVILSIDPSMKKAQTLSDTATKMATYGTISENEILDMKYKEAINLYKQGYLVEAQAKFEEILTINPNEEEARMWIQRINNEFTKIHTRRGYYAYKQGDYQEALNQWYNVLLINKEEPALNEKIAEVEDLIKKEESQKAIDKAFEYYSEGRLVDAYKEFNRAHDIQPGERHTQKFIVELREEIANNYYNAGNKAYNEKKYNTAIANWKEARKWGYNKQDIAVLIKNAERAKNRSKTEQKTEQTTTTTTTTTFMDSMNGSQKDICKPGKSFACRTPVVENEPELLQEVLPVAPAPKKEKKTSVKVTKETVITSDGDVSTSKETVSTSKETVSDKKEVEPVKTETVKQETIEIKEVKKEEETPVTTEVEGEDFPAQTIVEKAPTRVSEAARQASIKHYRYGLAAFSEGNYEKAKEEWQAALNLNPENSDAALGLKRVEEKYSNR